MRGSDAGHVGGRLRGVRAYGPLAALIAAALLTGVAVAEELRPAGPGADPAREVPAPVGPLPRPVAL